jgi:hypothetical protein
MTSFNKIDEAFEREKKNNVTFMAGEHVLMHKESDTYIIYKNHLQYYFIKFLNHWDNGLYIRICFKKT